MKSYEAMKKGNMLFKSKTLSYLENYNSSKRTGWTTTLECMANAFFLVAAG